MKGEGWRVKRNNEYSPPSTLHPPLKYEEFPMKLDVAIMNNTLRDSVALAEAAEAIGCDA